MCLITPQMSFYASVIHSVCIWNAVPVCFYCMLVIIFMYVFIVMINIIFEKNYDIIINDNLFIYVLCIIFYLNCILL